MMSASALRTGATVLSISAVLFGHVVLAQDKPPSQPQSLQELFDAIPKSPTTPQEADRLVEWSGQQGKIAAITALRAGLEAHGAEVSRIFEAADTKIHARMTGGATPEQTARGLEKGASAMGIDMARMQTDKAYAKEMEARMKAMSPQELAAIAAGMSQAMGMKGTVAVYDPPEVKAAAEAGQIYDDPDQNAARAAAYEQRWAGVKKKVDAADGQFAAKCPKEVTCNDGEGGPGKECEAARARYEAEMLPLLATHYAEILRLELAALDEERTALATEVHDAEQHLLAAQYGAASQELGNPRHIWTLDQQTAYQIGRLADKFEEIVTRAAVISHCGPRIFRGQCWAQ